MRRFWLVFSQSVTVLLAAYFVVATLKPEWIAHGVRSTGPGPSIVEAPSVPTTLSGPPPAGSLRAAAKIASAAVVSINTLKAPERNPQLADPWYRFFFGDQGAEPVAGLGSGVIVTADGYILTNNHVVEGADEIEVVLNDSRKARGKVIGSDPDTDLAILKIALDRLPVITLGNSDALQVGDQVLAIGNPFGVGQTVTSGIVSALGRNQLGINELENFIQTDAAINPGNSGGALVDVTGALMGINTAIYSRSGGSMGIGFAIPVNTARQVLESIVKEGSVRRGYVGVELADLSPELTETFGLKAKSGALVTGVQQNGPAAQGGIRPGDVVVRVGDKPVANASELMTNVAALKPGEPAKFRVQRRDDTVDLTVTPGLRPRTRVERRR